MNGTQFGNKKELITNTCNSMDESQNIMLIKTSHIEKSKYCMVLLICGISKSQTHKNRE